MNGRTDGRTDGRRQRQYAEARIGVGYKAIRSFNIQAAGCETPQGLIKCTPKDSPRKGFEFTETEYVTIMSEFRFIFQLIPAENDILYPV